MPEQDPNQEPNHAGQGGEETESDSQEAGVQPSQDEAVRVGGSAADGVEADKEEVAEEGDDDGSA